MRRTILAIIFLLLFISVYGGKASFLQDETPPEWRNQQQSASTIPQGTYITLQADGMDTGSLYYAMLATNESGEWRNETEPAFMWNQPLVWGFDNFGTATYMGGLVYAPSKGTDSVYCLNASDGSVVWEHSVRECDASPCIEGDVIYVGECDGPYGENTQFPEAIALNRFTGEEIWSYVEPGDYAWVGSPVINDDYIYYTTMGSGVYALNKTNGNTIWHVNIGKIVCSVAYHEGVVFVSTNIPTGQYALNATTGAEIWHQNYGASWDTSPVVYDGMIVQVTYVSEESGNVWSTNVLNESNGELIRRFYNKGSAATPLVHEGTVFIPSRDWRMWAYNLYTGEDVWHSVYLHDGSLQNHSYCSPAASGGAIYFQSLNGTFYILNETDGNVIWSMGLGHYGFGSISLGDGCAFVPNDNALNAFRIGPGSGNWTMFCQNQVHQSYSDTHVDYVRYPLSGLQYIKESGVWVTARFLWRNPTISSATIAWRIYFFDNYDNGNVTDVMTFDVRPPIHDLVLVEVSASKTIVGSGFSMSVSIFVTNVGEAEETFNVTAYANETAFATTRVVGLHIASSRTIIFWWNTSGFARANYTISAWIEPVSGETNTSDNIADDGTTQICAPCDITGPTQGVPDGTCNMRDIGYIASKFGTTPTSPDWDANCDITGTVQGIPDNVVNMRDIGEACSNFEQT